MAGNVLIDPGLHQWFIKRKKILLCFKALSEKPLYQEESCLTYILLSSTTLLQICIFLAGTKGFASFTHNKSFMTAPFDVLVWDRYRWQDSFFHFLQFSREAGFWDTVHEPDYLELLISRLIGSKSCAATRLAIILPQWWSNFNEFLFWHSYLASNNMPLLLTVRYPGRTAYYKLLYLV